MPCLTPHQNAHLQRAIRYAVSNSGHLWPAFAPAVYDYAVRENSAADIYPHLPTLRRMTGEPLPIPPATPDKPRPLPNSKPFVPATNRLHQIAKFGAHLPPTDLQLLLEICLGILGREYRQALIARIKALQNPTQASV